MAKQYPVLTLTKYNNFCNINSKLKQMAKTPERPQKDLLITPILWFPLNCELFEPWENNVFDVL